MAGIPDCRFDDLVDVDSIVGRDEAVRLDARQAHQILDDAQHSLRFVADRAAEVRTKLIRKITLLGERFRVAKHRR